MIKSKIALIIGLVLIAVGVSFYAYQHRALSHWRKTTATVTGNIKKVSRGGPAGKIASKPRFYPQLTFKTHDGREIKIRGDVHKPREWEAGQPVSVRYDPSDPQTVTMQSNASLTIAALVAAGLGFAALAMAFGMF